MLTRTHRDLPRLACQNQPNLGSPEHTSSKHALLDLTSPALPHRASPRLPRPTRTRLTLPNLNMPAVPGRALHSLITPCLTLPAEPSHATPFQNAPSLTLPRLACHALPCNTATHRAAIRRAKTCLPCFISVHHPSQHGTFHMNRLSPASTHRYRRRTRLPEYSSQSGQGSCFRSRCTGAQDPHTSF